jgi:folate-dependent phosphoribosylglycinamide formyltransferase PurN
MYGMYVHQAVVENKELGITVHYVNENYEGAIIAQQRVALANTLVAERIHELEQAFSSYYRAHFKLYNSNGTTYIYIQMVPQRKSGNGGCCDGSG